MSNFMSVGISNDDLFDAIIRQAVIKNHANEMAAVPPKEELEKMYTFSNEHNEKMKKLFAADDRQQVAVIFFKWMKVVIITVCITATLLFGTLLTSADFRKAVGDVIIVWFDKFTEFFSPGSSDEFTELDWSPGYLPQGFTVYDEFEAGSIKGIEYINSDNVLIDFSYKPSTSSTAVDNQDMEYDTLVENNIIYHIFEATSERKSNIIIWDMRGYRFTLSGNIGIDELIKIALSVNAKEI